MRPIHSGYFVYRPRKSTENIFEKLDLKELGQVGKFASF